MTEKFNNNEEIETVDGVHGETPKAPEKKSKKRFIKPLIGAAVVLVVAGGIGSYAHHQYEQNLRTKVNEAYSKVKINVVTPPTTTTSNDNQTTSTDSNADNQSTDANTDQNNNQAAATPTQQQAKSQDEIKQIVADTIGVDQNSITFDRIRPEFGGEGRYGHHGFRGERGRFYQNNNNNTTQSQYTYNVEARANDLEYELEIDALTGQVLDVDIDAH